jgi:hypothetical protein
MLRNNMDLRAKTIFFVIHFPSTIDVDHQPSPSPEHELEDPSYENLDL